jgi:polyribonucleotide nucleotidyltransferase
MRMIDRPIRPLFPDGFIDEVQIQCWVMSHDGENDTDVLAGTAASAAWPHRRPLRGPARDRPRGPHRHRRRASSSCINPTSGAARVLRLDLVLSGHRDGINMIEVGAAEITEDDLLAAIKFGYEEASSSCSK